MYYSFSFLFCSTKTNFVILGPHMSNFLDFSEICFSILIYSSSTLLFPSKSLNSPMPLGLATAMASSIELARGEALFTGWPWVTTTRVRRRRERIFNIVLFWTQVLLTSRCWPQQLSWKQSIFNGHFKGSDWMSEFMFVTGYCWLCSYFMRL